MTDERWFERLAAATELETQASPEAPARLKSRVYSALVTQMAAGGRLLSLSASEADGRALCVFERALITLPLGDDVPSMNPCRVCHARVLGERLRRAPIFWPGCPYADFHRGS